MSEQKNDRLKVGDAVILKGYPHPVMIINTTKDHIAECIWFDCLQNAKRELIAVEALKRLASS